MVDETLARSFESIGEDYERFRPGFPDAAAEAILPEQVATAVDLGAGTGKFTRLLQARADRVIAVEPSRAMLDVLRAELPWAEALDGGAERMPLADASADVVTVAQAFHWFDRDVACAEIARVLAPAGRLGLVWNRSDPGCAWDVACHRVLHPAVGETDRTTETASVELPGFVLRGREEIHWSERITRADYLRRWQTVSSYLVADETGRARMRERLQVVLDDDQDTASRDVLDLPHITDVFVYSRG
ncbi:MAG: class I SAM-dependent methyltransferase [Microbacterium sp.]|nr:class I SAM-dependent methyltransferase [Microbacterium sp.]